MDDKRRFRPGKMKQLKRHLETIHAQECLKHVGPLIQEENKKRDALLASAMEKGYSASGGAIWMLEEILANLTSIS